MRFCALVVLDEKEMGKRQKGQKLEKQNIRTHKLFYIQVTQLRPQTTCINGKTVKPSLVLLAGCEFARSSESKK